MGTFTFTGDEVGPILVRALEDRGVTVPKSIDLDFTWVIMPDPNDSHIKLVIKPTGMTDE